MSKYTVIAIEDFSGGENMSATPDLLRNNESRELVNMDPLLEGGVVSRWGTAVEKTPAGAVGKRYFEFEYVVGGARSKKNIALIDNQLVNVDTGAVIKTGLTDHMAYEVLDNKLYVLSNGLFFYYDGTTCTDVTTTDLVAETVLPDVKKCKYLTQRGDRLFAAGNPDKPNELYYSQPFNPSAWWTPNKTTTSAIPLGINPVRAVSDDGDIITGLKELHGALLVFKVRSVFAWFGFDPMKEVEFKRLDVGSGTISNRSICKVENALMYLGTNGVYKLSGTYENVIVTELISEKISPLIKRITRPTSYHNTNICAIYFDNKYLLSVPVDGETDCSLVLVLHYAVSMAIKDYSWSHYVNLTFNDLFIGYDWKVRALKAGTTKIILFADEYLNDEGALMPAKIRLRPVFVADKEAFYVKKFKSIRIIAKQWEAISSIFHISGSIDYTPIQSFPASTSESLSWDIGSWDVGVWDFSETVMTGGKIAGKGKRLDLEIATEEVDNKILLYKLGIEYKIKKLEKV